MKDNKTIDSTSTFEANKPVKQADTLQSIDDYIYLKRLNNCDECTGDCYTDFKTKGPFDIHKSVLGDTVKIVFHFVSDGGQKFEKVTKITMDTIYLDYKSISDHIYECYNDYKYEYTLTNYKGKTIFLKNKKI